MSGSGQGGLQGCKAARRVPRRRWLCAVRRGALLQQRRLEASWRKDAEGALQSCRANKALVNPSGLAWLADLAGMGTSTNCSTSVPPHSLIWTAFMAAVEDAG